MALSPQERIDLGLDDPRGEFLPAGPTSGQPIPPNTKPNLRLVLKDAEKATASKIRMLVNDLLAGNLQNADWALKQLFAANPKAALDLYVQLMGFSVPKLTAMAVQVDDRSDQPRAMSFADLQRMLTQDTP